MAIVTLILVVVFTVINLRIYHKIFHVVYFNLGQALFREILWSFFIAMAEVGVIIKCIKPILSGILKLLGALGKFALIVLAVAIVAFTIWKIVQMIKGNTDTINENDKDFTPTNQDMSEPNRSEKEAQNLATATNHEDTKEEELSEIGVELSEVGPNKVKVIKIVRDLTGLGLKDAKDLVDSAPIMWPKSVSKTEADNIKTKLEAEGAKVTLKSLRKTKSELNSQEKIHMVACISCGKSIDESAKFCKFCGLKMKIENESEIKIDMFACPNCGKTIAHNANFCHYCGEKIICEVN